MLFHDKSWGEADSEMDMFLINHCHQTTIFTDAEDRKCSGCMRTINFMTEQDIAWVWLHPPDSTASGPSHCGASLLGRWDIGGSVLWALLQRTWAALCEEAVELKKQSQWTSRVGRWSPQPFPASAVPH